MSTKLFQYASSIYPVLSLRWSRLKTLTIWDPVTGESSPSYLFVAVLPCSGYVYLEVCCDMKL